MIDIDNTVPSKAGLRSVLDVLKIQMNFWPTLEANFSKLLLKWGSYAVQDTSEFLEFSLGRIRELPMLTFARRLDDNVLFSLITLWSFSNWSCQFMLTI